MRTGHAGHRTGIGPGGSGRLKPPDFRELFAFCDLHASRWGLLPQHTFGLLSRPMYYDKAGFPVPSEGPHDHLGTLTWAKLKENNAYSRVAEETFPDGSWLSTVWMGLDQSHGFGEPLIFETMYFAGKVDVLLTPTGLEIPYKASLEFPDPLGEPGETRECVRTRTEEEALALHHEVARRIRKRWVV